MKFFCLSVWQFLCSSQNLFSFDIHYSLFDIRYSNSMEPYLSTYAPLSPPTSGGELLDFLQDHQHYYCIILKE
jgi:hypothetical protein